MENILCLFFMEPWKIYLTRILNNFSSAFEGLPTKILNKCFNFYKAVGHVLISAVWIAYQKYNFLKYSQKSPDEDLSSHVMTMKLQKF